MKLLTILLQCCVIVTVYQLSPCLAYEHESGHTQTDTLPSQRQDSVTLPSQRHDADTLPTQRQDSGTLPSQSQPCTNSIQNGIPGIPGIPGSSGPVGPPGLKGEDCQTGPKGDKGQIGSKGDGQTGQKGVMGKSGPQGVKGELGPKGDGQKGVMGSPGLTGPRGQQGQPGQQGGKGQAGEIQQQSRMAFSASRTSSLGPASTYTTVTYDKVYSNVGNGYSTSTGKFTCSVIGVYYFNISARKYGSHPLSLCMMKNNDRLPCIQLNPSNSDFNMCFNSVIIDLQQGDEVWVNLRNGNAFYSDSAEFTTFTGYLLYDTA